MIRAWTGWRESIEESAIGCNVNILSNRIERTVRVVERDGVRLPVALDCNLERLNVAIRKDKIVRCIGWY